MCKSLEITYREVKVYNLGYNALFEWDGGYHKEKL